jgi:hypothetical protein
MWTNFYNGPANGDDFPTAIAVDGSGNVFVTGYSAGEPGATIKYSEAGVPLWTRIESANGYLSADVAVDSRGNAFVTGSAFGVADLDYMTMKYSSTGVELWNRSYNVAYDEGGRIALDTNGNIFVVGTSVDFQNGDEELVAIKYSGTGSLLWANTSITNWSTILPGGFALAVDGGGNLFVIAPSTQCGGYQSYLTTKYSSAGALQWINCFASGTGDCIPSGIALDSTSGNVFVTGGSTSSSGDFDFATVAYSSAGMPLWTNFYNGLLNTNDVGTAIAVDGNGNVIVTGYSNDPLFLNIDYVTIKYSGSGVPIWTNCYQANDSRPAIAVGENGNVFVTGSATVAYSGQGVPLWTNQFGPGLATAVAINSIGNAVVTGEWWNGSNYDYATIMYSSGSLLRPYLSIQKLSNQTVLTWTNNGFSLQSAPAITGNFTNISGATSPYTNLTTGSQQYFRLLSLGVP